MASYKKLKSGWQFRVSYKKEDGTYGTKSRNGFRTKGEAQIAAEKVERLIRTGHNLNDDMTFGDYMQSWYETFKKDKHSKSNNADIELSIHWVKQYFKNRLLKDVTREEYQKFLTWYGDGRATATVRKVHIYAKMCLQDAYAQKHILNDPTYKVVPKGTKAATRDKDKYLNYKDSQKLVNDVVSDLRPHWHSRYMILIAIATGMRFSEVLALSWNDINFNDSTIRINKSFNYRTDKDFAETKTESSMRTIPVDNRTMEILKEFKQTNDKKYGNQLFIEETIDGYKHISNRAVNNSLQRACKRAGVKEITFHKLRHTHCSLLLYSGLNIKYISKRLGHSSTDITYRVYGHIIDEMEEQQSEKVIDFFDDFMK